MKELVVSLIISHGASQKALLSLPFSLSEGALPVACQDHLTFRACVEHACITDVVGNNACMDSLIKTVALLCRKFTELSLSIFIREIFALNSLLFSRKANAPKEEESEMWSYQLSALLDLYKTTFSSQAATWLMSS